MVVMVGFFNGCCDAAQRMCGWQKKTENLHIKATDSRAKPSAETALSSDQTALSSDQTALSSDQTAQTVPISQTDQSVQTVPIIMTTVTEPMQLAPQLQHHGDGTNTEAAHAVATGIEQVTLPMKKGRVRKNGGAPRSALAVKKTKAPKVPRNPFRRSETGKLQLKRLQMGKRVETMTPKVAALRERLDVMQERLEFVSGKLKLVVEELSSRTDVDTMAGGEVVGTAGGEVVGEVVGTADASVENGGGGEDMEKTLEEEMDDEIEQADDVAEMA